MQASIVAALGVLAGCAANPPAVREPEIRLSAVELEEFDFRKQTFLLSFDVSNPNAFPLPVAGVRYRVLLDRQNFAGGRSQGGFTIPANGSGTFRISVDLDLARSGTQLVAILGNNGARPIDYELHGSLDLSLPLAGPIAFSSRGTVTVQGGVF